APRLAKATGGMTAENPSPAAPPRVRGRPVEVVWLFPSPGSLGFTSKTTLLRKRETRPDPSTLGCPPRNGAQVIPCGPESHGGEVIAPKLKTKPPGPCPRAAVVRTSVGYWPVSLKSTPRWGRTRPERSGRSSGSTSEPAPGRGGYLPLRSKL